MATILICAPDPLADDLHGTLIWRGGNDRHLAASFAEALVTAVAVRPDLVVVDRDLPRAERLIEDLRRDPSTRRVSIVVAGRGEVETRELELLQAGANAVMRLPAGPEWDERLSELMDVPVRRAARVPVRLQFGRRDEPVETQWGAILNVSATGMLVEVHGALRVGTDIDFRFLLPGSREPIRGTAQVVRQDPRGRFGVHFYGLEGDGGARIRAFAASGSAAAPGADAGAAPGR